MRWNAAWMRFIKLACSFAVLVGVGALLGLCAGFLAIAPDEAPAVEAQVMADRIPKGIALGIALWTIGLIALLIRRAASK